MQSSNFKIQNSKFKVQSSESKVESFKSKNYKNRLLEKSES